MSVTVYSTPTCGYCQAAKRFLRDRHVRFREIDVSRDARAEAEIARKTGRHSVPVIDVHDRLFVGFDPRRLAAALGIRGQSELWPFHRASHTPSASPVTIDVREAWARARKGARLVDVRSEREFAGGHPKGARNLPPARIKAGDTGLAPEDEILVICLSGHRSPRQARKLATMGYANVVSVSGGLLAWKRAGLPVKASRR